MGFIFGVGLFWFIFGFWILCGIVAAVVASNKGRSSFGWGLLGFLLGPIGIVLALVLSTDVAAVEAEAIQRGEHKKCPFCAELVKQEAIICKHCGRELPVAAVAPIDPNGLIRVEGQSIGEWRENVMERYGVSLLGNGYLWNGAEYSSFQTLVDAIKSQICADSVAA